MRWQLPTTTLLTCAAPAEPAAPARADEPQQQQQQQPGPLQEGPARYVVYARRAVQALLVKGRLVAYTSDIGESIRPVVPPWLVRLCYGITWGYVAVDVTYNTAEEYLRGSPPEIVARTAIHAATFQTIASVLVPSLIIHQVVHLAQRATKSMPPGPVARWAPSLVGLALIPLLPYVDEPVEHLIDKGFELAWPAPKREDDDTEHEKSH